MSAQIKRVDHSALRVNQASIITLLIAAFILNVPWLVAVVAGVMLIGTVLRVPGFKWLYAGLFKPLGWVKPDILEDNPEPHVFAQGLGGVVLLGALAGFVLGSEIVGWALTWLVVALAALNLFAGFCAGCFVYYWLVRLNVPGFIARPPAGTFPGMRPSRKES
ncbi:MAG TPA: DUF4395 domain-containing protein [Anaerolineae bacterium]